MATAILISRNDKSIHCNGCDIWCHSSCAEIEQEDLFTLHKYYAVHWFCESCEALLRDQPSGVSDKFNFPTERYPGPKTRKPNAVGYSLNKHRRTKNLSGKITQQKTYAETVSPAESSPSLQTKTADKQPGHDLNKTLIVTNTSNFSNSVVIKTEMAENLSIETTHLCFSHSFR